MSEDDLGAAAARLAEVEAALQRIEEGGYGVCGRCGGEIADNDLEADPLARLCRQCRAGDGPHAESDGRAGSDSPIGSGEATVPEGEV